MRSPTVHRKSESNSLKPIFSNKKAKLGGVAENEEQSQVLKTSLQTDKYSSGEDKKGKIFINYETIGKRVSDSKTGYYRWVVKLLTNGKNGWLVQKMENTYDETLADGTTRTTGLPTAKYWEAWQVTANSSILPTPKDYWQRGYINSKDAVGTKGTWSIKGTAYFTKNDITKQGFKKKNVPDAGLLLSTTSNPGKLGKKLLKREQQRSWDSTAK